MKKLSSHLGLSLTFFFFTLTQEYLFYTVKGLPIAWLSSAKYLGIYLYFFLATFIGPRSLRLGFLSLILFLNLFQMIHLSYFGTLILPGQIPLLWTQFDEITGTVLVELQHVLVPALMTAICLFPGIFLQKKLTTTNGSKLLGLLALMYLTYNPVRTFVTGNTWGRQPSNEELGGMNLYLSLSYFTGRILPEKVLTAKPHSASNSSLGLELTRAKTSDWDKIIFIIGESLSARHMSLFGYQRETTPFLDGLRNATDFTFSRCLSSGVSSDVSVAFLLNLGFGEAGGAKAARGTHCFFKLAKAAGFETHFLSAQSSQQLRYISPYLCSTFLDDYRSLEDLSPETKDHQAADDKLLLLPLNEILRKDSKQFVVLHQRGSHGPWELRSRPENRRFPHEDRVSQYDNSVVEFDLFMKELTTLLASSSGKVLLIYVSDHGEALGENGAWGHGQLREPMYEVPLLMRAFKNPLPKVVRNFSPELTHYNVGLILAEELGYKSNQPTHLIPADYEILGNDMDGFAGKLVVKRRENHTLEFLTQLEK